jgi:geranylgeranyl pyrophosphate synthase
VSFEEKYAEYLNIVNCQLSIVNCSPPLQEVIQYSLESGGKRIRPVLTLAFCEAYGGDVKKAAPIAAAIEMLHTSTLIQDDLPCMDDDDFRRGKPAVHKAFSEADAVLAASAMMYNALEMIDDVRIIKAVCGCMQDVYDGQKLDLTYAQSAGCDAPTKEQILKMYEKKTCALLYLACSAGVESDAGEYMEIYEYALSLGLAFQLIDDILDGEAYDGAKEDAEKYTADALYILEGIPNSEFLTELTKNLLNREM